jgi:hypothetical protein
MGDVDMPDAGFAGPAKSKAAGKAKTGLGEGNTDSKKRFEVKKVLWPSITTVWQDTDALLVERCCSLGLGYCGRQLCYLQKSYHGSL